MHKSADDNPVPLAPKLFSSKERVQLMFLLKDLFPRRVQNSLGVLLDGYEWDFLYELLQRTLGRNEIGSGNDPIRAVQDFVERRATEDELFTLLELMPHAHIKAFRHAHESYEEPNSRNIQRITSGVNTFLQSIGSPARFALDGRFSRDGFTDGSPRALQALPGQQQLRQDLRLLCAEGSHVGVIFIDLDNFKAVNDTQGHAAGDKCLEVVASVAGTVIARKGKLYRYGGDEFAALLPNYTASEASATAERLRRELEGAKPGGEIGVTASIGVAASDCAGITRNRLLESADAAMYTSKKTKKNCVTTWAQGMAAADRKT